MKTDAGVKKPYVKIEYTDQMKYYYQLGKHSNEITEREYELRKRREINKCGFCYEYADCYTRILLQSFRIMKTTVEKNFVEKPFPEVDEFAVNPDDRPDWVKEIIGNEKG